MQCSTTHPSLVNNIHCITIINGWIISIREGSAFQKVEYYSINKRNTNISQIKLDCLYIRVTHMEQKMHLPRKAFNNPDFPDSLGPKTKHWKTFLSVCCFLRSKRLFLVTRSADDGSPVYPMYIKFSRLLTGSRSVRRAHCKHHHYPK